MDPALLREREAFKRRALATPTYVIRSRLQLLLRIYFTLGII